ncbi:MAG TPA: glycosyltransferase family 2 protein [Candidatus Paceibacterota bacterium]|nr:glycosyltransferase family 2 protein [Candidatus Paceibacterota bacterium]
MDGEKTPNLRISIVVPVYNEEQNLPMLFERLGAALAAFPHTYEVIMVDDGSKDGSYRKIVELSRAGRPVKAIRFSRNFGQTAALSAGIDAARGEIIVTLDSDLENDPADIQALVKKMDEGYDVVSGWRKNRWRGAFITRKLPSRLANSLISLISGVKLHDYGCTLKAYRADLIKGLNLYGDMHRFVAAYAVWQGGIVAEIPVSYAPRIHGKSNYGLGRTFRVLLDLIVMKFMQKYFNRPMHFFGGWGFLSLAIGLSTGLASVALKVMRLRDFVATPLPVFSALFIIVGLQFLLFGVLSEILMRTYYESQHRRPYVIKEVYN